MSASWGKSQSVNCKAVLHVRNRVISVPMSQMPELRKRLHLTYSHAEVIGALSIDHYRVN